jgi:hypothetical protein
MANLSKVTRDHEEIRRWAEARGGKPAHVKRTGSRGDTGILRIDFPGYSGEGTLETISWDEFFEKFDERGLSFLYQEQTAGGERSNFNKLVSGRTAGQAAKTPSRGRTTKKAAAKKAARKASAAGTQSRTAPRTKKTASSKKSAASRSTAKKTASKRTAAHHQRGHCGRSHCRTRLFEPATPRTGAE